MRCHYCLIKNKSDSYKALVKFVCETNKIGKTKYIYSDNTVEYIKSLIKDVLLKHNIKNKYTAPYTPQQNGFDERNNVARGMVCDAKLTFCSGVLIPLVLARSLAPLESTKV